MKTRNKKLTPNQEKFKNLLESNIAQWQGKNFEEIKKIFSFFSSFDSTFNALLSRQWIKTENHLSFFFWSFDGDMTIRPEKLYHRGLKEDYGTQNEYSNFGKTQNYPEVWAIRNEKTGQCFRYVGKIGFDKYCDDKKILKI
jgi:hypothetical protein